MSRASPPTDAARGDQPAALRLVSRSPAATRAIGASVGRRLGPGDVVALAGPLGAGKTVLAKGIADGLDLGDVVTSPTYTLVTVHHGGRVLLCHVDLYRLHSAADLDSIDWDGLMDAGGVMMVEWPERAGGRLPRDHLVVSAAHRSQRTRSITLRAAGRRADEILQAVRAALPSD